MTHGARWALRKGFGAPEDLDLTEENGSMSGADPSDVGDRPRKRGAGQVCTLGSGNHFLEVQAVDHIFDPEAAEVMGIERKGQAMVMFHCGSRGFGHQICQDYVGLVLRKVSGYGIDVPDRQLACAPIASTEGQAYLSAMKCAANYAWANRQMIAHQVRLSFERAFESSWEALGMWQVYDVSHNMAKIERHVVDGEGQELCVHRKGATRSFPPGHPDVPERYRETGQPVLIPGDMGRYSFLCAGMEGSLERSFGSACHGAGRRKSRHEAVRELKGRDIRGELREHGVVAMAKGWASLAEEAPEVYKDVAEVVETCERAGLARRVARLRPLAVVKG
jgi:tRNA-splicing ligase RtcB